MRDSETTFEWGEPVTRSRRALDDKGSVETVTITADKLTVSYSLPELSLTPEQEAALAVFWRERIDRLMRQVMGDFTAAGSAYAGHVPAREQSPPEPPKRGPLFPFGDIAS